MRVFVSHAGRDRSWAEWVSWQIEHAGWGCTVELDCWDWQAGDDFVARMNYALAECDRMLAVFSEAYFEPARWTAQEWTAAFRLAKDRPGFLVPVRVDDTVAPPLLGPLIAPALHGLAPQQARATLLAALRPPGRPSVEPPLPGGPAATAVGPRLPGVLPAVWEGVPSRNVAFTGRDGMLVRPREGLRGVGPVSGARPARGRWCGQDPVGERVRVGVRRGLPGGVVVNAERADRIGEQYAAFAVAWGLADPAAPVEAAFEALRGHCRGTGGWLVVLDNARNAADVHPWRLDGPGHVIVTSRDPAWPETATAVAVDVFTPAESITLLRAHVPTLDEADAGRLADAVGHLPLALAQAGGVLAATRMPAGEYLELLEAAPGAVLDEGRPLSYPASLAKAVRVTYARVAEVEPAAAQLVTLCGFLAPEPVPTGWFTTAAAGVLPEPLASVAGSRLAYRRLLGLLSGYGLVKLTDADQLTVHRLTQRLLRADATRPDQAAATVGRILAGVRPGRPTDPVTWPAWAELLPHLQGLDLAGTDDEGVAWQACEAAWYLRLRGEARAAYAWIAPLHQAWRDRLGPTSWPTLWAAHYLGQGPG